MLKRIVVTAAWAMSAWIGTANAAETLTANTLRLTQNEPRPSASIETMAWLAGTWRGVGLGGENEELWSEPQHGVMFGAYRMMRDGAPVFYELLTISEVAGTLEIRLKHFDPKLRGWEAQAAEAAVVFPLVAQRNGRVYFDGMTFEPRAEELTVYLAIENRKDATVREEIFRYRRVR